MSYHWLQVVSKKPMEFLVFFWVKRGQQHTHKKTLDNGPSPKPNKKSIQRNPSQTHLIHIPTVPSHPIPSHSVSGPLPHLATKSDRVKVAAPIKGPAEHDVPKGSWLVILISWQIIYILIPITRNYITLHLKWFFLPPFILPQTMWHMCFFTFKFHICIPDAQWGWPIYLQNWVVLGGFHVGKYTYTIHWASGYLKKKR